VNYTYFAFDASDYSYFTCTPQYVTHNGTKGYYMIASYSNTLYFLANPFPTLQTGASQLQVVAKEADYFVPTPPNGLYMIPLPGTAANDTYTPRQFIVQAAFPNQKLASFNLPQLGDVVNEYDIKPDEQFHPVRFDIHILI
jgi:hypothetical protein